MNGQAPGPVPADPLLDGLEGDRVSDGAETVARIRSIQDEVISRPADELLLVQGGAGTGTTVVGVRRVSWLLRAHPDRFADNGILVVGPTPSFVRQLSSVVPSSGDEAAVQVPLSALGPRVRVGRTESPQASRLKGDLRLMRVIQRALRHRQRITAGPVELTIDGRRVRLDGERIAERARQLAGRPHNEAHGELRAFLLTEVGERLGEDPTDMPARAVAAEGASLHAVDDYLDRAWPDFTPQSFLIGLLANPRQLAAAATGSLSDDEVGLLTIPPDARVVSWQWSSDDVALLDAVDELLNGPPATYEHVVVHEAQDLSPLQLESIRRRSLTGGMTVLGDLAQGTSAWAHSSWDDVVTSLAHDGVPVMTVELRLAYRLPSEVGEMAAGLLPVIAPGVRPPRALRPSGHDVQLVGPTGPGLAGAVAATVRSLVGTGSIAVIAPDAERHAVADALDDVGIGWSPEHGTAGGSVVVSSPAGCRGLEFDNVVVVEPAEILGEGPHGERALYVALTRCTDRLTIVHDRPLPDAVDRRRTDVLGGVRPAPVPSGGPPDRSMGEPEDRHAAGVVGDNAPTAAAPAVAAGERRPGDGGSGDGRFEDRRSDDQRFDGSPERETVGDRTTAGGGFEDGITGSRPADDRYTEEQYAGDRYRDGGPDRNRYGDGGRGDEVVAGDEGGREVQSSDNGLSGWAPAPPGWRQPVEPGRYDSGSDARRWAEPERAPQQPPRFERPAGVEGQPAAEGPAGVEQPPRFERPASTRPSIGAERPMHARPSGPGPRPLHPEPETDAGAWQAEPPPSHAASRSRTPWGPAPESPPEVARGSAPEARAEPERGPSPESPDAGPPSAPRAGSPPEPFAELDRAIAHAIARALTDKLARYATTELLPLVAEEMVRVIARRTGRAAPGATPRRDPVRRGDASR